MNLCHQECALRKIMSIQTNQLNDLNQIREDLEDLLHHEPARFQEIKGKTQAVNEKIRAKLARSRRLMYCIEKGCDACFPDNGVAYE